MLTKENVQSLLKSSLKRTWPETPEQIAMLSESSAMLAREDQEYLYRIEFHRYTETLVLVTIDKEQEKTGQTASTLHALNYGDAVKVWNFMKTVGYSQPVYCCC